MSHVQRPALGKILGLSLSRIFYPLWLIPMAVVAVLLPLHIDGKFALTKTYSEPVAPLLLAVGMLICVLRWRRQQSAFLVWLGLLLAVFFCRELHFAGTSTFVYVGFLALMFAAWQQYVRFADYLGSRLFLSLFSTAIISYIIAVGLDKHWWKFLPGDKYQWAAVEEYVEITGHLMLIVLALLCRATPNPPLSQSSDTTR